MLHSQFQEAIAFFKKPREISEFTSALKDFPWLEKTLYLEPDFFNALAEMSEYSLRCKSCGAPENSFVDKKTVL